MKKKFMFFAVVVLALALPIAVFAAGGWYDDFDSYADGTDLNGVGGWAPWDGDPNATAFVSSAMAHSAPHSVEISGTGQIVSDLVYAYSGYNSGQWSYRAWQYVPGNMTGVTYFIMLNDYQPPCCANNNWSVQVQFDPLSGVVISDETGAFLPLITDQWVELRLDIDLDIDQVTFYYDGTVLYTDSWTQGSGTPANIGAVDLWSNFASSAYYDDFSLYPTGDFVEISKSPDYQAVTTNGWADFTITVTNTASVTATMTVADPAVADCDWTGDVAPGGSATYTCTDMAVTGSYTNTAWVTGTLPTGVNSVGWDDAYVDYSTPTSASLSSFGSAESSATLWIAVLVAFAVVAAGAFMVVGRQRKGA